MGRGLTSRDRSSARGACSRRSLLGWGRRVGQSMERGRWNEKDAMDGRVRRGGIMRGMRRWTNLAWDRSAPRPRGASRPSAPSNPPRISDRTDGSGARSARVESSPACRPPVACRRDAASEEDPPSIYRPLIETRGRGHRAVEENSRSLIRDYTSLHRSSKASSPTWPSPSPAPAPAETPSAPGTRELRA